MQKILSAFFAFVLIIGSPVNVAMALGGGTYYVDASTPAGTGDGSLANPWTTISEAVAVAASGDTVNVAAGTYNDALGESFPLEPATGTSIIGAPGARIIQDEFTPTGISVPVFQYEDSGYGPTLLSGFTVSAIQDAINIRPNHTSSSAAAPAASFEISNNHIDSISGGGVYFYASYDDRATLNVHDNTFNVASVYANFNETLMGSIVISNNTFTDSDWDAIGGYLDFDSNTSASLSVDISGNTITNPTGAGIEYSISVSESEVAGYASVNIEGNTISGAAHNGIEFELGFHSSSNEFAADVTITNNTVSDSTNAGIHASAEAEYTSNSIAYNLTLDSNTVSDSGGDGIYIYASNSDEATVNYEFNITNNTVTGSDYDGLCVSFYEDYSTSAFMSVDMTISGNTLESNGGDGLEIYFSDSSGGNQSGQEWNVRLDNNTITDNGDSGIFLSLEGYLSESSTGAVDIILDFGTVTDAGANVIHSNLINSSSSPAGTSGTYADNDGIGMYAYSDKSWMPDILAIGNDWGTTDVESVIFHHVDNQLLPLVIFDEPSTGDNFSAPQAIYDPIATDMETAVTLDVSANDTDLDGNLDVTSVVIMQSASHGSVVNNGDGTVTYTPDVGWYGGDTIVYNISDTFGLVSNNATIGVMVNGTSNTIPTANFDSAATVLGVPVIIDVMANDTDADGDALDASSVAVNAQGNKGTAVVNGDGTITYTSTGAIQFGSNSADSFTYTVNDVNGGVSNIATVEIKLTLNGTTIR